MVNIKNVIHARKFDPNAARPKNLQYIVFGKPGEIYLAHLITRTPDFDQIIRVSIDEQLPGESLVRGAGAHDSRPERRQEPAAVRRRGENLGHT